MFDRISDGLWWDKAWSLIDGCTPVSPACANCWAAAQTAMRANHPNDKVRGRAEGLTADGRFNGQIRLNHEFLDKPLRTKKPTAWAVWNDLFHDDVDEKFIAKAFAIMGLCLRHKFLILTKRPDRMARLLGDEDFQFHVGWFRSQAERQYQPKLNSGLPKWPYKNVWLGVTAENQQTADERIPILLQIPAAVRFVSVEPMLGPVDLPEALYWASGDHVGHGIDTTLDWVICGGESGPNARPMHPKWVRSLQSQCQDAGVPLFFKQWGEWAAAYYGAQTWEPTGTTPYHYFTSPESRPYKVWRVGKKAAGRLLDGQEWLEIPEVER